MKTYHLFYAIMAVVTFGCTKSDNGSNGGEEPKGIDADYTVVLNENDQLTSILLNANGKTLTVDAADIGFGNVSAPQLKYIDDGRISMYHQTNACTSEIAIHDFDNHSTEVFKVFSDLDVCNVTVKAIVYSDKKVFLAYEVEVAPKESDFFVRVVNISPTTPTFADIGLDKRPYQMELSKGRLFVMTLDEEETGEHAITVVDANTNIIIHEKLIGFDARKLLKKPDGNIIIGYDKLHTTLNSSTMAMSYTNYGEGIEPNFNNSSTICFDGAGKMYYDMSPTLYSQFPSIPAIYDFEANLTVLYAYENFLSDPQLNFEYEIENTTAVAYDEGNNLLLIGYKKTSGANKGGLLRIKLSPEPELTDNIDLEGIPYMIYIK